MTVRPVDRRLILHEMIQSTVFVVALFFSGCAAGQETATPNVNPSTPDYVSYLNTLKKKVVSTWKYPPGISGIQTVKLRFVVDNDGKLVSAEVVDSTDARLSTSALEAMNRASPFLPVPEEPKKLAGEPMMISFTVSPKPHEPRLQKSSRNLLF